MLRDETRAATALATQTVADTVSRVEQVHRSIAARAFRLTAPVSLPARFLHDTVSTGTYGAIRGISQTAGLLANDVAGNVVRSHTPVGSTPASNLALALLNAALGDELAEQGSPLAISMSTRVNRADVPQQQDALVAAFPEVTPKLALFIHGLGETEEFWRLHAHRHGAGGSTYGSRLAEDFGYTPVYVRYNTGLHIAENGRRLSTLLAQVCAAWRVPVDEVLLVGHSMGGLVARSACHHAQEDRYPWVDSVRHVFYLGTPHLGAHLEQWVNRLSEVVGKLDEGRVLASVLDRRSAGIKDLHADALLDEGRRECADEVAQRRVLPLLPHANHYAISATVTKSRRNPLGAVVGDLFVHPASARGGNQVPFRVEHKRHFAGLHHFDLLNHPSVYEAMREWLSCPMPIEVRRTPTQPIS